MIKHKKKINWLTILIVVIACFVVGLKFYKLPKSFTKTYNNVLVLDNKKNTKTTTDITIDGKFYKSEFVLDILAFRKVLEGNITIGGQKYYLLASDLGKLTDNIIWGDVRVSPEDSISKYVFYLTRDTNKIYIRTIDDESFEMISPVENENDYNNIKKVMYGEVS